MSAFELNADYFNWMCRLVCDKRFYRRSSYQKVLKYLHSIDFQYCHPMDGNRAEDGIDLRYRFGYEYGYPSSMISNYIDNRPCSVLEMMVSLAFRCEEQIMQDLDEGDRTGKWFWEMMNSLGLMEMDDQNFNDEYVELVITKFMEREYERDGKGGLFTIEGCRNDMRTAEIWYQMNWYINTIL